MMTVPHAIDVSRLRLFFEAFPKLSPLEMQELCGLPVYIGIVAILCLYGRKRSDTEASAFRTFSRFLVPRSIYRHQSMRYDLSVVLLNRAVCIFIAVYFGVRISLAGINFKDALPATISNPDFWRPQYFALNAAWTFCTFFLFDCARSLVHYAFHKVPALWEFHKLHHDAPVLNLLARYRVHLVEFIFTAALNAFAVGVSYATFVRLFGSNHFNVLTVFGLNVLALSHFALGHFMHCHVWLSFGKWGKFLTSPASHQIHHSAEPRHRDKNFSTFFTVIDWLLGTLYVAGPEEHFKIGVRNAEGKAYVNRSLTYFYLGVMADSARAAVRTPVVQEGKGECADQDGLHCWCGPGCQKIQPRFGSVSSKTQSMLENAS